MEEKKEKEKMWRIKLQGPQKETFPCTFLFQKKEKKKKPAQYLLASLQRPIHGLSHHTRATMLLHPSFLAINPLTPNRSKIFLHRHRTIVPRRTLRCAAGNGDVDAFTKRSGYLFKLTAFEADSLTDYNVSKIAAIYRRKPLVLFRRLFQIGTTFGKWFALRYLDRVTEKADLMFEASLIRLKLRSFVCTSIVLRVP